MNNIRKFCAVLFAVLILGTAAALSFAEEARKAPEAAKPSEAAKAPGNEVIAHGWAQRCVEQKPEQKSGKKACEVFQRIDMKDSSARVAEFAVGRSDRT